MKYLTRAIIFAGLMLAYTAAVNAANYYATATGSGAICTSSAPCSLLTAITKPVAGDTVHVAPGAYSYASTNDAAVQTMKSGTASARIRYLSDTKWGAKIVSNGPRTAWYNYGNYVDIEGFDVTGNGSGGIWNYASYVSIINNHVHDVAGPSDCINSSGGGAGIDHTGYASSDNNTIGNIVHGIGIANCGLLGDKVHGIYHSSLRGKILNNISYNNSGYGIHNWHAAKQVTISNNLAFANGASGLVVGAGDAPGGVTADGFVVTNNMLINNGQYGISEEGLTGANTYASNIIYGNTLGATILKNGNTAVNTLYAAPSTTFINYIDDGTGDYHLSAASQAINRGTSQGAPTTDITGLARIGNPDMGPYEFVCPVRTGPLF